MLLRYVGPTFGALSLTNGKVYSASFDRGMFRVIDDSGEDYLYNAINPAPLDGSSLGGIWEIVEECQTITLCGQPFYIPKYYQRVRSLPSDPPGSVPYLVQTRDATGIALFQIEDYSKSMPRTKNELIKGVRGCLQPNQGIIQVETTNDSVYYITKTLKQDPDTGVLYILKYQRFFPNFIVTVHGNFSETGTTGMRDCTVFAWCHQSNTVGYGNDPRAGWTKDPYDETIRQGALMNQSELPAFDAYFTYSPLSMCRVLARSLESSPRY